VKKSGFQVCLSNSTCSATPRSSEEERWIPDYVGYHLEPVRVAADDVKEVTGGAVQVEIIDFHLTHNP
jgi:hypothetical protein